ncbi:Uma2 family endonuclease [Azospirillum sp.]|uniref:Uma2 family endonuclease n=1 Tax=Azospirillum sp. TaxID=34012 RepID=UPI002D5CE16D|nr:Uma2 family endonuclease [Azospirillum sp.]HYD68471.1 Uma2 family endonuclease [Azospirillum sp.]
MTALPHPERMTVEEFFAWTGMGDTVYELIDGHPYAQAAPSEEHAALQAAVAGELRNALAGRRPCRVMTEAGVRAALRPRWNYRQADVVVSCRPRQPSAPELIVKILSPSNEQGARNRLFYYAAIESVREVLFLDSRRAAAELYRRDAAGHWAPEPLLYGPGDRLDLVSIDAVLDMAVLYDGVLPDAG